MFDVVGVRDGRGNSLTAFTTTNTYVLPAAALIEIVPSAKVERNMHTFVLSP